MGARPASGRMVPMTAHGFPGRVTSVVAAVGCSAVLGTMVVHLEGGVALLLPTMLGILVLLALVRLVVTWPEGGDVRNRFLWWTIFAFISHLAFGLAVTNIPGIVETYIRAPDSYAYHNIAVDIVKHWNSGSTMPYLPAGKEGFYYVLAGLYWLFGAYTAAGLVVNATLAGALVPVVSDTTRRLFGEEAAARVPPLVVLMPGLMLWTSQLIKEAAILFLIAFAVNCAVRVMERITLRRLVGLAVALAILFSFRGWVALVVAGGLLAGIGVGRRQLVSGVSTAAGALAFIVFVLSFGLGYSGYQAAVNSDLSEANIVRRDLAVSGSTGFDHDADISTSQRALLYLPRGLLNFGLGPFPWQISGLRQLPILPDMVVWWFLLPSLWRGQREGRRSAGRRVLVLLLPAITTASLLALAVGNFGTVVRERAQVIVILVPLIALGLTVRGKRKSPEVSLSEPEWDLVRQA